MLRLHLDKKQQVRIINHLWANLGGLFVSIITVVAYHLGYFLASPGALVAALTLFWAYNIAFITFLLLGLNKSFKEPSLSLPQIYWATITTTIALAFTRNLDSGYYSLILLAMVFGILRVSQKQYFIFCAIQISVTFSAITFRHLHYGSENFVIELVDWVVFMFVSLTLAKLCMSIVGLRIRLKENNQKLEEALQVKSNFLATMSHEIRTPMNGVIGMLDIAVNKESHPDKKSYLNVAYTSAQSLLNIINDLLSFSKIEQEQISLNLAPTQLESVFSQTAIVFSSIAKKEGVDVLCDIGPRIPKQILCDETKLKQIINNLVGNAVKFTHGGHIILRAKLTPNPHNGSPSILIAVSDTGIGIPKSAQKTLFDPFTQVDSSSKRKYEGTGLGLSIANKLATAMGSPITVASKVAVGSTFSFYLDLLEPSEDFATDKVPQANLFDNAIVFCENKALVKVLENAFSTIDCIARSYRLDTESSERIEHSVKKGRILCLVIHIPQAQTAEDSLEISRKFTSLITLAKTYPQAIHVLCISNADKIQPSLAGTRHAILPTFFTFGDFHLAIEKLVGAFTTQGETAVKTPATPAPQTQTQTQTDNGGTYRAAENSPTPSQNSHSQKSILVADDNAINLEVAKLILEPMDFNVVTAANGQQALDTISAALNSQSPFDLVLMDCQMPILDGYEASRAIRSDAAFREINQIPIIAVTANAMEGDKEKCFAAGMSDYIPKPIRSEELIPVLEKWLNIQLATNKTQTEHDEPEEGETHTSLSQKKVWNKKGLMYLLDHKVERALTISKSFALSLDETRDIINKEINEKDWALLRATVHTLKGSAANVRCERLSAYAAEYEQHVIAQDESKILDRKRALLFEMAAASHYILEECKKADDS